MSDKKTRYQSYLDYSNATDIFQIIGNMQGVIEQLGEKLKHVEAMAKDIRKFFVCLLLLFI